MKTIAHLSDLHFGRHDPLIAKALSAMLRDSPPDLTVISGDLTQRARRRQFAAAHAFLKTLPPPLLIVPGNHDVPLYDVARRFLRPLARYRRYIARDLMPFYADAEIAVLGINTARSATLSNGRFSLHQADHIRETFRRVPAERLRILVAHHPLMPPPRFPDLPIVGRAKMALRAIAEAGVRVVLCGHHHQAFAAELNPGHLAAGHAVLIIEAGTAISLRLRGEPNSFDLLEVAHDRLTCTPQVWQGAGFVAGQAADYTLVDGDWLRDWPPSRQRSSALNASA